MERIAYVWGDTFIYWNSIVLTASAVVTILLFLSLYLKKEGNPVAAFVAVALSLGLSLVLGRLVHWYSSEEIYGSFRSAMTNYASGGYSLIGIFAGCFLAAALTRMVFLHQNLPKMLDCMSVAGCAGMAVGRLSFFFNNSDRGKIVSTINSLPWAYPSVNVVSGAQEMRLATFVIQSMVALVLLVGLAIFYLKDRRRRKDGDATLIFLLCYCASQIVLDSTRYDPLYFRSNGFVSIVQVLGAITLAGVVVVFSVRMVKNRGFRGWYVLAWLAILGAIGGTGYMEYYVQRHPDEAKFAYSVMSGCLLFAVFVAICLYRFGCYYRKKKKKKASGR